MKWLNLELSTLRSPGYLASAPAERATWLQLLAYCADQENGGVIPGAATWKDRQWQQVCGVTARAVRGAARLIAIEGGDVRVAFYPAEQEAEAKARRIAASEAANRRWHGNLGKVAEENHASGDAQRIAPGNAQRNAKDNGRELQGQGNGTSATPSHGTRTMEAEIFENGEGCAPVCLLEQVLDHGRRLEPPCPEQWSRKWWEDSERRGWLGPDGLRIVKWQPALSSYWRGVQAMERRVSAQQGGGANGGGTSNGGNATRAMSAYEITTKLRGIEEELGRIKLLAKDGRSDDGLRTIKLYTPEQQARRAQLLQAKEILQRKLTEAG